MSATKILVSARVGSAHKVFKIDVATMLYYELVLPSDFTISDLIFVSPISDDLSYMFVGKTSSVNDGTKTNSWSTD